jgi:N-acetyl-anhydromuramyl-L-alanine amidase AmpD
MNIDTSHPLKTGEYIAEETAKTHIVWHGTQGRTAMTPSHGRPGDATSSIDGWNDDPQHVGATYLIDRDGTTYRTFDDKYWIYHLGLKGTNGAYDKRSVGIELANELCLKKIGDKYYAFDAVSENTEYVGEVVEQSWREYRYWAKFDEAQVDACIELTLDICQRYRIDPVFYYPSTKFDGVACFEKATIICHSNCREDKQDLIIEDWMWDKIKSAGIKITS